MSFSMNSTPTRGLATGESGQSTPRVPAWGLGLFILTVTASTLWPFWWGLIPSRDRAFMLRDMMVPFSLTANDLVLGKADYAPRALPQDAILAVFSPIIPSTTLAAALVLIAAACGILGAVKMARDMAGAHRATQLVCGLFVVWNPYVIERLLQGQWSLALAVMLLPAISYCAATGFRGPQVLLISLAGLTPAGLVLGALVALVFSPTARSRALVLLTSLALASPWLLVTLLNGTPSRSSASSAEAFAVGPDGPLGTVVSVLGLGGIWNAGAIPPSRGLLGALAGLALFLFAAWGIAELWRVYRGVAVLTAAAFSVPLLLATPVGLALMRFLVAHVPGAALFRDTHKLVGLALPGLILLLAVGLERLRQRAVSTSKGLSPAGARLMGGVAPLAVGTLVIATVPGYPADVAPTAPQRISPAWASFAETISGVPRTKILLFPPGNYRLREDGEPTLTPALKMLPGQPLDPQFLIVDGKIVDGDRDTIRLIKDTMAGRDTLAASGVGWVIADRPLMRGDEKYQQLDELLEAYPMVDEVEGMQLYRIPQPHGAGSKQPSTPAVAGMVLYWITQLGALGAGLWSLGQARRDARRRALAAEISS
ncbi:hypothetical protein [Corynebacterium urealyticum]|uniref:hypothetical protein n=1 Tax=Corynebacterium urealyticum TaxID=43771 RepID=UPI00293E604D|nr:hypothetical protein [Corynebacterium urealyticum]WOH94590.1 hypothetical protein RZ943_00880 [Corynebacterium urealyticum]